MEYKVGRFVRCDWRTGRAPRSAVKAFIKLLPRSTPSEQMIKEVQMHVKTRLAAHEAPREIEFLDYFPLTVTGKIVRRESRAREEARRIGKE